jgi:hypothetical protein
MGADLERMKGIEPSYAETGKSPFCHYKAFSTITLTCPKARDATGCESYDRGLPPFRRKPHDQRPEIIPGQILSRPQFNKPLALWTFEPKDLRTVVPT